MDGQGGDGRARKKYLDDDQLHIYRLLCSKPEMAISGDSGLHIIIRIMLQDPVRRDQ